jgi:large subunit ribosomal protein L13
MKEKIVDGKNAVLGRLASWAAKQSLEGLNILIVNSEKVLVTGKKKDVLKRYKKKRGRVGSSQKGPKFPTLPERIIKRTIKGMLPKNPRGKNALKRIKCYESVPKDLKNKKIVKSGRGGKGIRLEIISKRLRGE